MEAYTDFAGVYDLLMDDIPYRAWCEEIVKRLRGYGIADGLVLDLGCGTGTMTQLLAEAGYDMIGVDHSAEMLDRAVRKKEKAGADILYLLQDMRDLELYGTVRAVICCCDGINYLTEPADVLKCFRKVHNYLDPGGVFLFDFNTSYKYRELIGESVIAENREECSFIWENAYDEEEKINEYELTLFIREKDGRFRRHAETHYQRAYEEAEMRTLLEQAGMRFEGAYDDYTQDAPTGESGRIVMIAQKGD